MMVKRAEEWMSTSWLWRTKASAVQNSNDRDHPEWPSFFHAFGSEPLASITLRLLRLLRPLVPKGTSAAVVVVEDRRSD